MEEKKIVDITTRVIAICDDEEVYRVQCMNMCKAYFRKNELKAEILLFSSAEELIGSKKQFNIIFLDIEMPSFSGIEAKKLLAKTQPRAAIVFITNYPEYEDLAFGKNVHFFIRKPLVFKEIYLAINQINKDLTFDEDHVIVNSKRIVLSQVIYMMGEDKYVRFVLYGGDYELVRGTMNEWEEKLKEKPFCRIHKSYIVNFQWIKSIKGKIYLKNGDVIPVSRHFKKKMLKAYLEFLQDLAY